MAERSVTHATFRIERVHDAASARVFAAFSDKAARRFGDRPWIRNDTIFQDIVEDERMVFSYSMSIDGSPFPVSLATIELASATSSKTRLTFTERDACLDGRDDVAGREAGTRELLEALGAELERQRKSARAAHRKGAKQ